jgi:hypothetical protein
VALVRPVNQLLLGLALALHGLALALMALAHALKLHARAVKIELHHTELPLFGLGKDLVAIAADELAGLARRHEGTHVMHGFAALLALDFGHKFVETVGQVAKGHVWRRQLPYNWSPSPRTTSKACCSDRSSALIFSSCAAVRASILVTMAFAK